MAISETIILQHTYYLKPMMINCGTTLTFYRFSTDSKIAVLVNVQVRSGQVKFALRWKQKQESNTSVQEYMSFTAGLQHHTVASTQLKNC